MPIQVMSIANEEVIVARIIGKHDISDSHEVCQRIVMKMDEVQHPCHVLVDMTLMYALPADIVQMREASRIMFKHSNFAMLASFGLRDSTVVKFMANTLSTMFRVKLYTFAEEREAIAKILSFAPHLSPNLENDLEMLKQII